MGHASGLFSYTPLLGSESCNDILFYALLSSITILLCYMFLCLDSFNAEGRATI
jgi:hypothetical protein